MAKWRIYSLAILILLLLAASCGPGKREETHELRYAGPIEFGIGQGEFLPGTGIQYLGKTEEGALVSIGGQTALKKIGDSLNWVFNPVDGVAIDLGSRIVLITGEKLHILGTAKIIVQEPAPRSGAIDSTAPIRYKIPVDYHIKKGATIPGTGVTYLGQTEQGAHLGNIEGYGYREIGDSIVWKGQLRDRIWLELGLRTVFIGQETLNVAGTAELLIAP